MIDVASYASQPGACELWAGYNGTVYLIYYEDSAYHIQRLHQGEKTSRWFSSESLEACRRTIMNTYQPPTHKE